MDKITNSLETVCFVSLLGGVLCAVVPSGRMKGAFYSFCAVLLIFSLLIPLGQIDTLAKELPDFKNEKADERLASDVRTAEVQIFEKLSENALDEMLEKNGFHAKTSAECESTESDIIVKKITVTGDFSAEEKQTVEGLIKNFFSNAEVEFN